MLTRYSTHFCALICALTFATVLTGCCGKDVPEEFDPDKRKVMILYSAGFNSLSSFLRSDIEDLKKGYLPGNGVNDDILLVYSHLVGKTGRYSDPASPYLFRLYKGADGTPVADTLVTYPKGTVSASAGQLNKVLSYVRDEFPARSHGLVFSSHATGYLPVGYYEASDVYEASGASLFSLPSPYDGKAPVPYVEPDFDPSLPMVKSLGQDRVVIDGGDYSYEMDIVDFAQAIPLHLDYIIFDACLMGGVEVALQLRDVCDVVGFSQAEVLAEGCDYTKITNHLLLQENPDPVKVCTDYFLQYDGQTGARRSATISTVDCSKLEPLVQLCSDLFAKYQSELVSLDPSDVQRYYRSDYHWFYDLESIITEVGATDEELAALRRALDGCILYKAATPSFMGSFKIEVFSGLSMFLPSNGGTYLKNYYRGLEWNRLTGLVP